MEKKLVAIYPEYSQMNCEQKFVFLLQSNNIYINNCSGKLKPAHCKLLKLIIAHTCTNDKSARIFELYETLDEHNVIGKNSKRHRG